MMLSMKHMLLYYTCSSFNLFASRWILKCHACFTVTAEIGRIFCPKCGNGGTLRKVAVTVNENGIMLAARRPRVTLRGTKVSVYYEILLDINSIFLMHVSMLVILLLKTHSFSQLIIYVIVEYLIHGLLTMINKY